MIIFNTCSGGSATPRRLRPSERNCALSHDILKLLIFMIFMSLLIIILISLSKLPATYAMNMPQSPKNELV